VTAMECIADVVGKNAFLSLPTQRRRNPYFDFVRDSVQ